MLGWPRVARRSGAPEARRLAANSMDPKKVFWTVFGLANLAASFAMPFMWSLLATPAILLFSWWLAYRSGLFC